MSLTVLGIGSVNACGSGIKKFESALKGELKPQITEKEIETSTGKKIFNVFLPVVEGLDRFIAARKIRRLDNLARMVLLSSFLSIEDSEIEITDKSRVGIIFGSANGPIKTTFGFLDSLIDHGDKSASPTNFANSVHNSLASQISIFLNITGPTTTITCFNHTVGNVFLMAENWLNNNIVDYVIAGLADEYCDVLGYSFVSRKKEVKKSINPFSFDDCSFLPGEGSVSFLLSNKDISKKKYGKISNIYPRMNINKESISGSYDAIFLSSYGNKKHGSVFNKINFNRNRIGAYSPYYGGLDTGTAFEISAALLSNKNKTLYKVPVLENDNKLNIISNDIELEKKSKICCIEYCDKDELNLYEITD